MLGFYALGRKPLGRIDSGAGAGSGEIETVIEADFEWHFDELKPRDIGIYPVFANIGGGIALAGNEPVIDSGIGYWRIILGAIPVKTRANILLFRGMEAKLQGRAKTVSLPIYDGKRAPWVAAPGGEIDAEANASASADATELEILVTSAGDLEVGMHFSAGPRLYRIESIDEITGGVHVCTIWPSIREAITIGDDLEFRRPVCMMRLADDLGMSLTLEGLKRGEASVEFVEAI